MKATIKYYFESAYWIIRNELKDIYINIKKIFIILKKIFSIKYYIYVLISFLIFIPLKDINNILIYSLIFAIIFIYYKKIKSGDWKSYMRKKKGYKL